MIFDFDLVRMVLATTVSSMLLNSLITDVACCVCMTVTTFSERNLKYSEKRFSSNSLWTRKTHWYLIMILCDVFSLCCGLNTVEM